MARPRPRPRGHGWPAADGTARLGTRATSCPNRRWRSQGWRSTTRNAERICRGWNDEISTAETDRRGTRRLAEREFSTAPGQLTTCAK